MLCTLYISLHLSLILSLRFGFAILRALTLVRQPQFLDDSVKKGMERRQQVSQSQPPVSWCKKLKSIEITRRAEDETHMLNVLLEISEGMSSTWWSRVKISSTIV
jgi:hypothetical protein